MSTVVFSIGSNGLVSLDVQMTAQAAVQIVRRLGPVSSGFLVHALWTESAVNRQEAQAAIDLALAERVLTADSNGRLVVGPNAHTAMFE